MSRAPRSWNRVPRHPDRRRRISYKFTDVPVQQERLALRRDIALHRRDDRRAQLLACGFVGEIGLIDRVTCLRRLPECQAPRPRTAPAFTTSQCPRSSPVRRTTMPAHGQSFNRPPGASGLAAAQDADEKPVGIGAARGHQQPVVRHQHDAAEQEAALAERIRRPRQAARRQTPDGGRRSRAPARRSRPRAPNR